MPGGLGSPMSMPQQQQSSINWSNVGAAAGGSAPYTSGIAPDQTGGQTFAGGAAASDPFPGMAMPGGLNSPMTTPEPGASFGERFDALGGSAPAEPRTYDFKPMFEGGGGGGFGSGGTESQTFGRQRRVARRQPLQLHPGPERDQGHSWSVGRSSRRAGQGPACRGHGKAAGAYG